MEVKTEHVVVVVIAIFLALVVHVSTGTREVTGLVVSISYSDRLYPHTWVTFALYTPEGVIVESTFERVYSGNLELKLGCVYRIKTYKEFFQLWRKPISVELIHCLQGSAKE